MKNIGIYYRVSTDRQDLESQKNSVEGWLDALDESKKPQKTLVFKDEGISGKTSKRPGYNQLLETAYQRKIDTIVVYRLDRFSRNASQAIQTLLALDEVGVAFISVTQPVLNLGHENPFRRTMLAAFAEIAEIERQTIVARVKSGLEAAKKRGTKLGPPRKAGAELQKKVRIERQAGKSYRQLAKEHNLSYGAIHKLVNGDDLSDDPAAT